jgi:hypothetical protein
MGLLLPGVGKIHVLVALGQKGFTAYRHAGGNGKVHRQRAAGCAHCL